MLKEWDRKHPGRVDTMFTALQNIVPSHLADGTHYDFKGLTLTGVADDEGDKAFDPRLAGGCRAAGPASHPDLKARRPQEVV